MTDPKKPVAGKREWWVSQFKHDPDCEPLSVSRFGMSEDENHEVIHVVEMRAFTNALEQISKLKKALEETNKLWGQVPGMGTIQAIEARDIIKPALKDLEDWVRG